MAGPEHTRGAHLTDGCDAALPSQLDDDSGGTLAIGELMGRMRKEVKAGTWVGILATGVPPTSANKRERSIRRN